MASLLTDGVLLTALTELGAGTMAMVAPAYMFPGTDAYAPQATRYWGLGITTVGLLSLAIALEPKNTPLRHRAALALFVFQTVNAIGIVVAGVLGLPFPSFNDVHGPLYTDPSLNGAAAAIGAGLHAITALVLLRELLTAPASASGKKR
eukprot:Unigene7255_Nuclearia_a/m.22275 Unigene7255_Nuclearia_a/g.22275  ORF Unigene7255_Nuclearia_a/g.22275 Unigene7255_Nuclearia_a/m.22275 type:complete len:149 (-) Unigene7255_Nuclearia_a:15-461(-)